MISLDVLNAFTTLINFVAIEENYGTEEAEKFEEQAFVMASEFEWDWEADDDWLVWSLKATNIERAQEGRRHIVEVVAAARTLVIRGCPKQITSGCAVYWPHM